MGRRKRAPKVTKGEASRYGGTLPTLAEDEDEVMEVSFAGDRADVSGFLDDLPQPTPSHASAKGLQWVQPTTKTHRARYENELAKRGNCRGALEDDGGEAWPSVKLLGVTGTDTVHLDVYATTSDGFPHPYFYCNTAGRDAPTCCHGLEKNGLHALRFTARRAQDFVCELKHVGIVRKRKETARNGGSCKRSLANSQTNYFHLRVIPRIPISTSPAVSYLSEAIKCISSTQAVSNPVVTQIFELAGQNPETPEVIVYGKDFGQNTHFRIFQEQTSSREMWQVAIPPGKYTVMCSHSVRFRMPWPPRGLKCSRPDELSVFMDAASNTVRRASTSIPLSMERAVTFQYRTQAPANKQLSINTAPDPAMGVVATGNSPPLYLTPTGPSSPFSPTKRTDSAGVINGIIHQLLTPDANPGTAVDVWPVSVPRSEKSDLLATSITFSEFQAIAAQGAYTMPSACTALPNGPGLGVVLPATSTSAYPLSALSLDIAGLTARTHMDNTAWPRTSSTSTPPTSSTWPNMTSVALADSVHSGSMSCGRSDSEEPGDDRDLNLEPQESDIFSLWNPNTINKAVRCK